MLVTFIGEEGGVSRHDNVPCGGACSWGGDVCTRGHCQLDCMHTGMPSVCSPTGSCHSCATSCSRKTVHLLHNMHHTTAVHNMQTTVMLLICIIQVSFKARVTTKIRIRVRVEAG